MEITKAEYEKLYRLAYYDNLTGCHNRNWYFENLHDNDEFMFVMADINGLKQVNDKFGHSYGDKLIKSVASHLMRFGDVVRFGGDEFILIVPKDFKHKILDDQRYCYGYCIKSKEQSLEDVLEYKVIKSGERQPKKTGRKWYKEKENE